MCPMTSSILIGLLSILIMSSLETGEVMLLLEMLLSAVPSRNQCCCCCWCWAHWRISWRLTLQPIWIRPSKSFTSWSMHSSILSTDAAASLDAAAVLAAATTTEEENEVLSILLRCCCCCWLIELLKLPFVLVALVRDVKDEEDDKNEKEEEDEEEEEEVGRSQFAIFGFGCCCCL